LTWEEGSRYNHYNILHLNNTVCIIKNGDVLKVVEGYAPKKIYLTFPSNRDTLHTFFKECGRETSRPCDIQCLTCKNVEISTGFSKEHVTEANVNTVHEENSHDSEYTQKFTAGNTESTDSSTKTPLTNNNHVSIIISVISVIVGTILVIAVAYIIKRCKSNHTENKKEEQKLQQVKIRMCYIHAIY
jgi:hypothetical protein